MKLRSFQSLPDIVMMPHPTAEQRYGEFVDVPSRLTLRRPCDSKMEIDVISSGASGGILKVFAGSLFTAGGTVL